MSLPPSEVPQGAIRFNTDSQKLEFYAQGEWWIMSTDTPNLGQGTDSTPGTRGVFAGGFLTPGDSDTIDYINISSTGNAVDFGNLTGGRRTHGTGASQTRGLCMGGYGGGGLASIDTITIASTGDATDYGDLVLGARWNTSGASNATRSLLMGGETPSPNTYVNEIEYMVIASTGAGIDFGNLTGACRPGGQNGLANPTRVVVALGNTPSGRVSTLNFIAIATLGDAQDFGDLSVSRNRSGALSNATRGLFGGGGNSPTNYTLIDYITIASGGNASKFGDLTVTGFRGGAVSSPTRGAWGGGVDVGGGSKTTVIDYVEIATEGNAVDFGDLSVSRGQCTGISNAHGGL